MSKINHPRLETTTKNIRKADPKRPDATKVMAEKLAEDFLILKQQSSKFRHKPSKYSQEVAKKAYNRLKDAYKGGTLNDTAKGWFKDIGFDYINE